MIIYLNYLYPGSAKRGWSIVRCAPRGPWRTAVWFAFAAAEGWLGKGGHGPPLCRANRCRTDAVSIGYLAEPLICAGIFPSTGPLPASRGIVFLPQGPILDAPQGTGCDGVSASANPRTSGLPPSSALHHPSPTSWPVPWRWTRVIGKSPGGDGATLWGIVLSASGNWREVRPKPPSPTPAATAPGPPPPEAGRKGSPGPRRNP